MTIDFTAGLFRGFQTLNSLLPGNNLWCRVSEIKLIAHPKKVQKRIAEYKIVYWKEQPTEIGDDPFNLAIVHEGLTYNSFVCEVNYDKQEVTDIVNVCVMDFLQTKAIGLGFKEMKKITDMLAFYRKSKYVWKVATVELPKDVIVNDAQHETILKGTHAKYPPVLFSHIATIRSGEQTLTINTPYQFSNLWFREACIALVSPNTLKAIVNSTIAP